MLPSDSWGNTPCGRRATGGQTGHLCYPGRQRREGTSAHSNDFWKASGQRNAETSKRIDAICMNECSWVQKVKVFKNVLSSPSNGKSPCVCMLPECLWWKGRASVWRRRAAADLAFWWTPPEAGEISLNLIYPVEDFLKMALDWAVNDSNESYFNVLPLRQAGHKAMTPRIIKYAVQHDSQWPRVHLLQTITQNLTLVPFVSNSCTYKTLKTPTTS